MRFGFFDQLPCPDGFTERQRYKDILAQIDLADTLGFDTVWLGEIHFIRQFSILSDPLMTLAAAAQRTPAAATASRLMTAIVVPMVPRLEGGKGGEPERLQDCPTCPWVVRIPAGSFVMGQGARDAEAMPTHRVEISAFALGQTPVTVAEWKACMAAGGCNFLPRMRVTTDNTPVHNLSWDDTTQYLTWLSRTTGHRYRLPTEAEWEYAARGGTTTRYWWGDVIGVALANCADCGGTQDTHAPLPVDGMRPNPFGLVDMLGGVAQWTADCWFPNYQAAPSDGAPREAKNCEKRVLRGGGFREGRDQITVTARGNYDASVRYPVNGLRVARDPN